MLGNFMTYESWRPRSSVFVTLLATGVPFAAGLWRCGSRLSTILPMIAAVPWPAFRSLVFAAAQSITAGVSDARSWFLVYTQLENHVA